MAETEKTTDATNDEAAATDGDAATGAAVAGPPPVTSPAANQPAPGLVWHGGKLKPYNPAEHGAKYEVRSPVAGFNGERAGVVFRNGFGFTDDDALVAWFEAQKYAVAELPQPAAKKPKRR